MGRALDGLGRAAARAPGVIQRTLNTDAPRKEDVRFVLLAPSSTFKFPRVFKLSDPNGYYQTIVVPRCENELRRMLYGQLHRQGKAPRARADVEPEGDGSGAGGPKGGGRATRPKCGGKGSAADPKGGGRSAAAAYPAGKKLRRKESEQSVNHAPRAKDGRPICWDAACHRGLRQRPSAPTRTSPS